MSDYLLAWGTELAWAAGFLDGEGWFGLTRSVAQPLARTGRRPIYYRFEMGATQVDQRPLLRLREALGVGIVTGPFNYNRGAGRPIWHFRVRRKSDALKAVRLLWPFMSAPKREQVLGAVWAQLGHRRLAPHGNSKNRQPEIFFPLGQGGN